MGWEILLGAALEVGLDLLAEVGFGDEARALKDRLTKRTEKARQRAFEQAFQRAVQAAGEESIHPLLAHRPFQEAVITGLLDPTQGFDLQAAAEVWGERLPGHAAALRRFFSVLESTLLADETWGPLLQRYQELRFRQDVVEALRRRQMDTPSSRLVSLLSAELHGSGAIAQGPGAVAAGAGGVAVGGDVLGNIIQTVVHSPTIEHAEFSLPHAGPRPDALRVAYLKRLTGECGALRLLGLDTSAGHAAADREGDVPLEAVYVHLDTTRLPPEEMPDQAERKARRAEEAMRERRPLTALEAAARLPRLVLTGGPGAGKSTFVNYLVLCLAAHDLPADDCPFSLRPSEHLPGWPDDLWPLPVRVILREFARGLSPRTPRGTADLLWQHIERSLAPLDEFKGPLKEALLSGQALLVLDGLDEVAETSQGWQVGPRRLVLQAVEDFALRAFPRARYLVTCRTASYVSPWTLPNFEVAPLAEFNQEKRDLFCRLWYGALARRGQLDASKVPGKIKGLQRAIRRPDLARMAGNPLLLTVMALVHAREPELPEARALLYDRCVDVLLWLWERRKEEGEGRPGDLLALLREAGVDRTFFIRTLARLAYDVHGEGGTREGEADIRASVLERRLETLHPQRDPAWARRAANFLRERAGLLVERQADELDPILAFPHRTFQEYLAACWLTQEEDTARKAYELARSGDHWWEVVRLAAGRLLYVEHKGAQPLALVDWLCPEAQPQEKADWRLARLAGEVLLELKPEQMQRDETLRPKVEALLERMRQRLVAALRADQMLEPCERAAAGDVLAQLGDPRFRADAWFLPDEPLLGFVEIPAGPFTMGSDPKRDPMAYDNEMPQHQVMLPGYYIARYPVTVAQWRAFVKDSGHEPVNPDSLRGVDNHPVVWVTWYEAVKYCQWLTKKLREWEGTPEPLATLLRVGTEGGPPWVITLPGEAQWEKAARGTDRRIYPWGDDPDPNRANYGDTGIGTTSAVGCFPGGASPYGVEDLSGNVWEWCRTKWQDNYKGYRDDNRLEGGGPRVLRGGAFIVVAGNVRCACRNWNGPNGRYRYIGFRLVASPVF